MKHDNHGMEVNGVVTIVSEESIDSVGNSPTPKTIFNNIPMSEIYANHIVKEVVDINHYKIEVTTSANKTGYWETNAILYLIPQISKSLMSNPPTRIYPL